MLRVIPDREVAKDAARINVSALAAGQERIFPAVGRFGVELVKDAVTRGEGDLDAARMIVAPIVERLVPSMVRPLLSRLDPER